MVHKLVTEDENLEKMEMFFVLFVIFTDSFCLLVCL